MFRKISFFYFLTLNFSTLTSHETLLSTTPFPHRENDENHKSKPQSTTNELAKQLDIKPISTHSLTPYQVTQADKDRDDPSLYLTNSFFTSLTNQTSSLTSQDISNKPEDLPRKMVEILIQSRKHEIGHNSCYY